MKALWHIPCLGQEMDAVIMQHIERDPLLIRALMRQLGIAMRFQIS